MRVWCIVIVDAWWLRYEQRMRTHQLFRSFQQRAAFKSECVWFVKRRLKSLLFRFTSKKATAWMMHSYALVIVKLKKKAAEYFFSVKKQRPECTLKAIPGDRLHFYRLVTTKYHRHRFFLTLYWNNPNEKLCRCYYKLRIYAYSYPLSQIIIE